MPASPKVLEFFERDRRLPFLFAGEPPIYVGFGSMIGMATTALASLMRKALSLSGRRAVIAMGCGGMRAFRSRCVVVPDALVKAPGLLKTSHQRDRLPW